MRTRFLVAPVIVLLSFAPAAVASGLEAGEITFTEHVAPIVFNNCASCHRPGEGTPFSLLSYKDVKRRGELIRDVTTSGYMPPWPPAKGWGHFQDERRLSADQIATIQRWVEAKMPEGPADKLPALPAFSASGWTLGEPDLVAELPEAFDVPPDGADIYRMFVLPLNLPEDKWVTAVEIRPTAKSVVHHALYFLDDTGGSRKLDEADPKPGFGRMAFPRTGSLGGWAVGATPRHLPMDLAYAVRKGSDLIVQMHFHPSGKAEREKTRFGLYFAKQAPKKKLLGTQAPIAFGLATELRTKGIQPGNSKFTIHGEWKVPFDIDLVLVGGHAHYLCKTMKAVAEEPDGTEHKLFAIDDWDFNWQGRYNYAEPVRLKKDTVIRTTLAYDNSEDNPRNPSSPPKFVKWGEGSFDEMGSIGFAFVAVNDEDLASYNGPSIFSGGDQVARLGGGGRGLLRSGAGSGSGMLSNLTPQQTALIYLRLDKNRNGKLEGDEIPERLRPFLGAVDRNGDQAIEPGEIEEFRQEMRKLRGETSDEPEPETSKPDAPAPRPPSPEPMSDINGRPVDPLHPADGIKANVLIFVTHDCPVSNQYSQEINRIARDYTGQSVAAYLVHVEPDLPPEEAKTHAREYGLDLPILLIDRKHALVQKTGAKTTPEAAVIAPDGTIAYCGRIDDRFTKLGRQRPEPAARDLRAALDAVLKGEPIAHPRIPAIGCPIPDLDR